MFRKDVTSNVSSLARTNNKSHEDLTQLQKDTTQWTSVRVKWARNGLLTRTQYALVVLTVRTRSETKSKVSALETWSKGEFEFLTFNIYIMALPNDAEDVQV